MKQIALAMIVVLSILIPTAHAQPIQWTFEQTTFLDGGTASGSFTFDPDTNATSNINFSSTAGTSFGGATYDAVDPNQPSSSGALFFYTGAFTTTSALFFLQPDNPLTDAGGAQHFTAAELQCQSSDCGIYNLRRTGEGYISSLAGAVAPTPEPTSIALLGTGLLTATGLLRRRCAKEI